jgi:hypothetical protein
MIDVIEHNDAVRSRSDRRIGTQDGIGTPLHPVGDQPASSHPRQPLHQGHGAVLDGGVELRLQGKATGHAGRVMSRTSILVRPSPVLALKLTIASRRSSALCGEVTPSGGAFSGFVVPGPNQRTR